MAQIINFNKARKRLERDAAQIRAAENRIKFGRTPAEKARDIAAEQEAVRRLDGIRREPPAGRTDPDPDPPNQEAH